MTQAKVPRSAVCPAARPAFLAAALAALAAVLFALPAESSRQSAPGLTFGFDPFGHRARAESPTSTTLYHHDPSGRLLGASLAGATAPHTTFRYDPLGRRVAETSGGVTTLRLHVGEQVVEEHLLPVGGGQPLPRKRLLWGDGIDELLAYQWDGDLDGTLESLLYPLTDAQGTVHALADAEGTILESYLYRPDGSFRIFGGDLTRPELVLARLRRSPERLELTFSEPVQAWGEASPLTLTDPQGQLLPGALSFSADRRTLLFAPAEPLPEGEPLTLALDHLADLSGNRLLPLEFPFTVQAGQDDALLHAGAHPELLAILDGPGQLALVAGVPIDPGSLAPHLLTVAKGGVPIPGSLSLASLASTPEQPLQGHVLLWTPDDPSLYQGELTLRMWPGLADLAGRPLEVPLGERRFVTTGQGDVIWARPADAPAKSASQLGNDRFLHGRPYVPTLGLYDHRARFYDPATATFLGPDPLGPIDSPNLYQAFGLDPQNNTDPFGECLWWNDKPCLQDLKNRIEGLGDRAGAAVADVKARVVQTVEKGKEAAEAGWDDLRRVYAPIAGEIEGSIAGAATYVGETPHQLYVYAHPKQFSREEWQHASRHIGKGVAAGALWYVTRGRGGLGPRGERASESAGLGRLLRRGVPSRSSPLAALSDGASNAPIRLTVRGEEFIHYGYAEHAAGWRQGARPGTFAGSFRGQPPAATGTQAQDLYNLPRWREPPNAYYLIRPSPGTPVQGPGLVPPAYGRDVLGLDREFLLPYGTHPGTVVGPHAIPVR